MSRPISLTERRLSYLLLALLPAIAAGIYIKGQRYDPNVFALDQTALEPPSAAEGPRRLPRDALTLDPPSGWRADGDVETFTAETLYEKIDGRAEEYLTRGARGLQFASLTNDRQFVDVFVYDMGTREAAAAMFAAERPPQPLPLEVGDGGYGADASAFFHADRYYVQIVASEAGDELANMSLTLARRIAASIRAAASGRD